MMLVVKCTMSAFQGDKGDTVSFHNNYCFSLKISNKAKLFMYKCDWTYTYISEWFKEI